MYLNIRLEGPNARWQNYKDMLTFLDACEEARLAIR